MTPLPPQQIDSLTNRIVEENQVQIQNKAQNGEQQL